MNAVNYKYTLLTIFFSLLICQGFSQVKIVWSTTIDGKGSFSSPRVSDLNGDGVKDIVFGAGRNPFIALDSAVIALDGKTGAILWVAPSNDQMFGSPSFMDISGDGVEDIFINGRSGILKVLDGKNGRLIWEFLPGYSPQEARDEGWYNFYNPQFVEDVDNDGVKDILISSGGDVLVAANNPDRPIGLLVVISGKHGKLIAKAEVPDGKETYLSVVTYSIGDNNNPNIIYGTGGETISGSLYITTLNDVLKGDLSNSTRIAHGGTKGFIAPPVMADITGDGKLDIIAMAVDGRMIAIDGDTKSELWSVGLKSTEAFTSMAVGRFNSDTTPDFFAVVNTGIWPTMEYAISLVVDGKSGQIIKSDTVGYFQMVSPIAFDIDNNEFDEVLLHTNIPTHDPVEKTKYVNILLLFDFKNRITQRLGPVFQGAKQASTPWIGDLDNDGILDVVMLYQIDVYNWSIFGGIDIIRLDLGIKMQRNVTWGSYMGSYYDGIYRDNRE